MKDDKMYTFEIDLDEMSPKKTKQDKTDIFLEKAMKRLEEKLAALDKFKIKVNVSRDNSNFKRDIIFDKNHGPIKSTRDIFLEQAREYADRSEKPTEFVPLRSYWPTYDRMSRRQKKWYFFWRDLVRHSEYPETSVSYVYLFAYEIINQIGVEDNCDGFIKLCSLWREYKTDFPEINKNFATWVEDYISVYFEGTLPECILDSVVDFEMLDMLPSAVVLSYIIRSKKTKLGGYDTIKYISRFSSYKIENSSFLKDRDKTEVALEILSALNFTDYYLKENKNTNLLQYMIPETKRYSKRIAFANAIYSGKPRYAYVWELPCEKNAVFKEFFTALIKHIENVLRKEAGRKRLLKAPLNPKLATAVEKYINNKHERERLEKRVNIKMDSSKVKNLIYDSNEIRDKLLDGSEIENDLDIEESVTPVNKDILVDEDSNRDVLDAQETDDFEAMLSETQKSILSFFSKREGFASEDELSNAFAGVFVQMEIDAINEAALDFYGDILIIAENNGYTVQEF